MRGHDHVAIFVKSAYEPVRELTQKRLLSSRKL